MSRAKRYAQLRWRGWLRAVTVGLFGGLVLDDGWASLAAIVLLLAAFEITDSIQRQQRREEWRKLADVLSMSNRQTENQGDQ